jgi:hypothetical protein
MRERRWKKEEYLRRLFASAISINQKWFQFSNVNFQCSPYFAFFQTLQFKGFGPRPLFFFLSSVQFFFVFICSKKYLNGSNRWFSDWR